MQFRHEWKHLINYGDHIELKQRLCAVLSPDPHAEPNGTYSVRSLYFDNVCDKVLREKLNGVNNREKFRIRYYKDDPSFLRWEKKAENRRPMQQADRATHPSRSAVHCGREVGMDEGCGRPASLDGIIPKDALSRTAP